MNIIFWHLVHHCPRRSVRVAFLAARLYERSCTEQISACFFLSVLSGAGHLKNTRQVPAGRARAAAHACNHNYDDSDFRASRTEICQNYDLHCSVASY